MPDALLVLNAGSSSLKFSIFRDANPPELVVHGEVEDLLTHPRFRARRNGAVVATHEWPAQTRLDHQAAIAFVLGWGRDGGLGEHHLVAVGHRVVHGGPTLTAPTAIDAGVLAELEALVPLAPLHQPPAIAAIRAVSSAMPDVTQVACFDTTFHATQPDVARAFALPRRYAAEGVCRYGFHGLSYEYIAATLPRIASRAADGRTIVAHLGNGASLCAIHRGQSVATTMGFTPLDGLVMGTRCGALDPGAVLYLLNGRGMDGEALQALLYEQSGLLGVSGVSSDMRTLLASAEPAAAEAVDLFVYRIVRELGSLAAALGGLDALVFTGGIGEHAAPIRSRVCAGASWLGLELDEALNAAGGPCISRTGSGVTAWVIPTDEELMAARHTQRVARRTRPRVGREGADRPTTPI